MPKDINDCMYLYSGVVENICNTVITICNGELSLLYKDFCCNDIIATFILVKEKPMEKLITSMEYVDDIIQVKMMNVMKTPIFIARIFEIISEQEINVDMISQVVLEDEMQLAYTCDSEDQDKLIRANESIKKEFPQIEIYQNRKVSKIYVHGKGMKDEAGVAAKMFQIFGKENIPFYQVTTSSTSISYLVDKDKREVAWKAIKREWDL